MLGLVAVSLGYYASGVIGTALTLPPSNFAIFWPTTSVLIATLLLARVSHWPAYFLCTVPAHFLLNADFHPNLVPLVVGLTQCLGNFCVAAATAAVLRLVSGHPFRFNSYRNALSLVILGSGVVPAVMNGLVISVHMLNGWADDFLTSWRQWLLAGILPNIVLTPLIVVLVQRDRGIILSAARRLELAVICAGLLLTGASFVLRTERWWTEFYWPSGLLAPLALLFWAAVRTGLGGACFALLVFAGTIILPALGGYGPFADHKSLEGVVSLQVFLSAVSGPLVLLSALLDERRLREERISRSESQIAAAGADTGLWHWDEHAKHLWLSDQCYEMFDLDASAPLTPRAFLRAVHADDQPRVREELKAATSEGRSPAPVEFRVQRAAGDLRWYVSQAHSEFTPDGKLLRTSGVVREATERVIAQEQAAELLKRLLTLQDDERKRIAEELHDSTGQHLAAINLNLGALRRRTDATGETNALFEELHASLSQASREVRSYTFLLRPPELERHGLCGALERYVAGFAKRTGIVATYRTSPVADELPIEHQRALLRITQESLANVNRHAQASRICLQLRNIRGSLHLIICDNGVGFRPSEAGNIGVGLPGMAARTRQLGGRLEVRSSARGATIHVALPTPGLQTRSPELLHLERVRAQNA